MTTNSGFATNTHSTMSSNDYLPSSSIAASMPLLQQDDNIGRYHHQQQLSLDNFLAMLDEAEADSLFLDNHGFPNLPPPEEGVVKPQHHHHSHNKTLSSMSFVQDLSSDDFLKLIDAQAMGQAQVGFNNINMPMIQPSHQLVATALAGQQQQQIAQPMPNMMICHQVQQPQAMMPQLQAEVILQVQAPSLQEQASLPGVFSQVSSADHQQPMMLQMALNNVMSVGHANSAAKPRRTCSVPGCPNRKVQGGLCIGHGAKRKTCGHPGCDKHVKKAGLCSTHGPARKRCEVEGCIKVSVQGGRCIAHGAKKKACSIPECHKQGILGGMCKRHHDSFHGIVKVRAPRKKAKLA
jgi:hypothetical protein